MDMQLQKERFTCITYSKRAKRKKKKDLFVSFLSYALEIPLVWLEPRKP